MRNVVVAVVVVLAGVTANLGPEGSAVLQPSEPPQRRAAGREAAGAASAKVPENPVDAVAGFFAPNAELNYRVAGKSHVVLVPPRQFPVRFLMASVPDPQKTLLPLYFDRWVESIILAAQDSGYSFDRFWLPWRREAEPEGQKLEDRQALEGWREGRLSQPGLLLFRPPTPNMPVLGIWLVGETPTAGLDRHQFHNAVLYSRELSEVQPQRTVILAPTFSGSVDSLVKALDDDVPGWRQSPEFRIATGSASVLSALEAVSGLQSAVHDDQTLMDALFRGVMALGLSLSENVAVLAEQGTAYGSGLGDYLFAKESRVIAYPRDISRLRNVYPDESGERSKGAAGQPQVAQPQLSMRLRDLDSGRDSLPYFSPQTPISQESALLQIADSLKRMGANLVVVSGTNVLDVLFLSRFLRQTSPDSRVVLYDSDLLFIHGTDTLDFQGMLAVSTYPLLPPRNWSASKAEEAEPHLFAANAAQGVYEASRALISGGPLRFKPDRSAVWLTVVGRNRYWPINVLSPDTRMRPGEAIAKTPPTRVWTSLFLAGVLLCSIYVAFLALRRAEGPLARWISSYEVVTTAAVLLAFVTVGSTAACLAIAQGGAGWTPWAWAAGAVGGALIMALGYSTRKAYWPWTALVVAAATGFCLWLLPLVTGSAPDVQFRLLRSAELFSGVAPNVPLFLLLLGLALWGWTNIQRFTFVTERQQTIRRYPVPEVQRSLNDLARWMRQGVLYIDRFGCFLGLATGGLILVISYYSSRSLEPRLYDRAVGGLLALTGALLVMSAYAVLRMWLALRVLLQNLELQPLRYAFTALPPVFSWSPIWQGTARKRTHLLIGRSLDSLRLLQATDPNFYPSQAADIAALSELAGREMDQRTQRLVGAIARRLEDELAARGWKQGVSETLDHVLKESGGSRFRGVLRLLGGGGTDVDVKSQPEQMSPTEKAEALAAEMVALRYLAFIRYVMLQARNLLSCMTTGFILGAIALNSYSFQAMNLVRWSITIVFLLLAGTVTIVFLQMDRDAILSRLADTEAGRLDSQFFVRMISVGALPLLTVIASQFPSVGRFLFAWLQPALAAMH